MNGNGIAGPHCADGIAPTALRDRIATTAPFHLTPCASLAADLGRGEEVNGERATPKATA